MTNTLNRKIGYMASLGFQTWSIEEISKGLANLGYSAVEWTLAHFNPHQDIQKLIKLQTVPTKYGLAVSEIVVQKDFVTLDKTIFDKRVEFVADSILTASNIGIDTINLFTGPAPWDPLAPQLGKDISEGEAWKLVLNAFQKLLPLAEKHHVYLAIEAVFGHICHDYYTLSELLRQFNSEYLVVNLDPSHFQLYGNDLSWVVDQLAPYIHHVHLKDVSGKPGMVGEDFLFPLLGEGNIDWIEFTNALDRIHYQGCLSVEFEAFSYFEKVLENDPLKAAAFSMDQVEHLIPPKK
ncbi:MAG: sugar phosphate isomerase/epimerase [Anaerolineaceae bacterium]|nr:sugar phosphate isomerase/epimerase [Anaerolineaceae bacterium]